MLKKENFPGTGLVSKPLQMKTAVLCLKHRTGTWKHRLANRRAVKSLTCASSLIAQKLIGMNPINLAQAWSPCPTALREHSISVQV